MLIKQLYIDRNHPNRPGTKLSKVTGVVVHWTANEGKGADAVANRNYFARAFKGTKDDAQESGGGEFRYASAHLNVDDTELVECLPWKKGEAEMGYHVGASTYMSGITGKLGSTYPNNCTIGLEICVNSDGDFKKAYANGLIVITMMLKEHGLGIDSLYRHYDITGKACPGFFTNETYAQKYLSTTAAKAWASFRADVAALLSDKPVAPPAPRYFKVYIDGALYKYQFATTEGAEGCANDLFIQSGGKNTSIYATDPDGNTIWTPSKHPEAFPQFANVAKLFSERVASTDVKLLTLPKGTFEMQLVWAKGKKVSELVKQYGADYGINFPFFWDGNPVADTKIGATVINSGYGKQVKWTGLKYKDGAVSFGKFPTTDDLGSKGFLVKTTPVLVEGGKNVQAAYVTSDETAPDIATSQCQRTALGLDKDGNVMIVVTDGREGADNVGLSLNNLANYLVSKGAVTALNGDGGGSSVLANKSGVIIGNVGVEERAVNHAVLIYLKAPAAPVTPPPVTTPTTPEAPKTIYRLVLEGKQQGAYGVLANGQAAAQDLYRKTKSPNLVLNNPDGTAIYTPSKHPEDFPDLIVDGLNVDTQKAVLEYLKKKFQ